jgi:multidrug efflux pump subunit AcrA (membrane-fusion protein)
MAKCATSATCPLLANERQTRAEMASALRAAQHTQAVLRAKVAALESENAALRQRKNEQ